MVNEIKGLIKLEGLQNTLLLRSPALLTPDPVCCVNYAKPQDFILLKGFDLENELDLD